MELVDQPKTSSTYIYLASIPPNNSRSSSQSFATTRFKFSITSSFHSAKSIRYSSTKAALILPCLSAAILPSSLLIQVYFLLLDLLFLPTDTPLSLLLRLACLVAKQPLTYSPRCPSPRSCTASAPSPKTPPSPSWPPAPWRTGTSVPPRPSSLPPLCCSFQPRAAQEGIYFYAEQLDETTGLAEGQVLYAVLFDQLLYRCRALPVQGLLVGLQTHPTLLPSIIMSLKCIKIMDWGRVVVLLALIAAAQGILFAMKGTNVRKCFYTEHSPDKTLEARLGILRREKHRCHALFSIALVDSEGQEREEIYSKAHLCEQAKTNDPYVVKHTSEQQDYQGSYEVCVQLLQNQNPSVIVQVFMGEKLNPIIFEHSDAPLPLIASQDVIDLDLTVQSIKRSLVKSRGHYQRSRESGEQLDAKITELMDMSHISNIMQIIALIVFGICWLRIVQKLKRGK